jgi:hypothetical protein
MTDTTPPHHRCGLRLHPSAGLRRDDRLLRRDPRPAVRQALREPAGRRVPGRQPHAGDMRTADFGGTFSRNAMPIALQVDHVAVARERLEAKGVRFVSDTFDSGVCWQAICLDPDGNPLSLHHRYAPKDERPRRDVASHGSKACLVCTPSCPSEMTRRVSGDAPVPALSAGGLLAAALRTGLANSSASGSP